MRGCPTFVGAEAVLITTEAVLEDSSGVIFLLGVFPASPSPADNQPD